MVGEADRELILGKFDVLVSLGLRTRSDSSTFSVRLARQTCLALQKLVVVKKTKGGVSDAPFRLPEEHVLFQRLTDMMVRGMYVCLRGVSGWRRIGVVGMVLLKYAGWNQRCGSVRGRVTRVGLLKWEGGAKE